MNSRGGERGDERGDGGRDDERGDNHAGDGNRDNERAGDHPPRANITLATLAQSVFAGFFGVQSEANRKRDFESGQFWHFVAGGIVFMLFFIGAIIAVAWLIAGG